MKGRKFTSYAACKAFWDFWHSERTLSTLTSRATKLRIPKKRELQSGLDLWTQIPLKSREIKDFISVTGVLLLTHLSSYFKSMLQLTLII